MTREDSVKRLVSLVEKARGASQSVSRIVFLHFELIEQARGLRVGWKEIGESLEFGLEKIPRLRKAYSLERRRRTKKREKEVVPEKKKDAVPDAKAKTQKESTLFRSEDKPKGGRIGSPKPIGRGRLDLGEDTPDDEL